MDSYLNKMLGNVRAVIWNPFFIMPFLFILIWNYRAFFDNENMNLDFGILIFKSNFLKFILVVADFLISHTFYIYLKVTFFDKKQ